MSSPTTDDPALHPICSHAVSVMRAHGVVVGRASECAAIDRELRSARTQLSCVTLEGEPGIGKTRLLVEALARAEAQGFTTIAVTADEELRGPFMVARSLVGHPAGAEAAAGTPAEEALHRALRAISGRDDPSLEGLEPERKLLRTFDLAAVAITSLARVRPVAILVDDLQWADDDSIRLIRYVVRSATTIPLFLLFSVRSAGAEVTEAVTLLADMERMGVLRRMPLARFGQQETGELLAQVLGSSVHPASVATIHGQAEGVPFIVEEVARAYRDQGMLHQIDGTWSLAKNAARLVPSSVRTLIKRRGSRLPEDTKTALAEAAVLGRSFSMRDLAAVHGDGGVALAGALEPALAAGLLVRAAPPADYAFAHNQIRELALDAIPPARRQEIHAAIVDMLDEGGDPPPASLPLLAHHALAAGDAVRAARFSVAAAADALASHAPEEVLRLVEVALPVVTAAQDRLALLTARDDALGMLRRPTERLEVLAELNALAQAMGDSHLELEVMVRRAAAMRLAGDEDGAVEQARRARELAAERGDPAAELAASLELGQAIVGVPIGEGYELSEGVDLDAAEEAYARAETLARELGDDAALAAAIRELGVISFSRAAEWFISADAPDGPDRSAILQRAAAGETPEQIIPDLPIAHLMRDADARLRDALQRFERLGDRRGVMSSLIGLAYTSFGPDIHFGPTAARRIEEIRRLAVQMDSLAQESNREVAEAQMLFGVHVFARAKMIPDLALSRGEAAHRQARLLAEHDLAFAAAYGTALVHLEMGDLPEAERWIGLAAEAASQRPTPLRARQLEMVRGMARAAAGDAAGMREHLEHAVRMAEEQGRPAARAEALARLALEAAALGGEKGDEDLLPLASARAQEAKAATQGLPGHPPWGAQSDTALALVARARGDAEAALASAREAMAWLQGSHRDDMFPEILLPAAAIVLAHGEEQETAAIRGFLNGFLALIARRTLDDVIRVRWFRGPVGRRLSELAGPVDMAPDASFGSGLSEDDARLLKLLAQGLTNQEVAQRLEIPEEELLVRLGRLYGSIGVESRGEATAFAFRERVI